MGYCYFIGDVCWIYIFVVIASKGLYLGLYGLVISGLLGTAAIVVEVNDLLIAGRWGY
jgi:hypothetical protein